VMLETGVLVQAVPLWKDEFERPEAFSNPGLIADPGLIAAINPGLLKASGRSNSSFQSGTACTRTPVLFGSRARGTHDDDSDAALALILSGPTGERYRIAGISAISPAIR
jgi:hypothetical protein